MNTNGNSKRKAMLRAVSALISIALIFNLITGNISIFDFAAIDAAAAPTETPTYSAYTDEEPNIAYVKPDLSSFPFAGGRTVNSFTDPYGKVINDKFFILDLQQFPVIGLKQGNWLLVWAANWADLQQETGLTKEQYYTQMKSTDAAMGNVKSQYYIDGYFSLGFPLKVNEGYVKDNWGLGSNFGSYIFYQEDGHWYLAIQTSKLSHITIGEDKNYKGGIKIQKTLSSECECWGVDENTNFQAYIRDSVTGLYLTFSGTAPNYTYKGTSKTAASPVTFSVNSPINITGVPSSIKAVVEESLYPTSSNMQKYIYKYSEDLLVGGETVYTYNALEDEKWRDEYDNVISAGDVKGAWVNQGDTLLVDIKNSYPEGGDPASPHNGNLIIRKILSGSYSSWGVNTLTEFHARVALLDSEGDVEGYLKFSPNSGECACLNSGGVLELISDDDANECEDCVITFTAASPAIITGLAEGAKIRVEEVTYEKGIGWRPIDKTKDFYEDGYAYHFTQAGLAAGDGDTVEMPFDNGSGADASVMEITNNYEAPEESTDPVTPKGNLIITKQLTGNYGEWGVTNNTQFTAEILSGGVKLKFNFDGTNYHYDEAGTTETITFSVSKPALLADIPAGKQVKVVETSLNPMNFNASYIVDENGNGILDAYETPDNTPSPLVIVSGLNNPVAVINDYVKGKGDLTVKKELINSSGHQVNGEPIDDDTEFGFIVKDITDAASVQYLMFDGNVFDGYVSEKSSASVLKITSGNVSGLTLTNLPSNREYQVEEIDLPESDSCTVSYGYSHGEEYAYFNNSSGDTVVITNEYLRAWGEVAVSKVLGENAASWGVTDDTLFNIMILSLTESYDYSVNKAVDPYTGTYEDFKALLGSSLDLDAVSANGIELIFLNFTGDGYCGGNTNAAGQNWYNGDGKHPASDGFSSISELSVNKPLRLWNIWAYNEYRVLEVDNAGIPSSLLTGYYAPDIEIDGNPGINDFEISNYGDEFDAVITNNFIDTPEGTLIIKKEFDGNQSAQFESLFYKANVFMASPSGEADKGKYLLFSPKDSKTAGFDGSYECVGYYDGGAVYDLNDVPQPSWTIKSDYIDYVEFSKNQYATITGIPNGGSNYYMVVENLNEPPNYTIPDVLYENAFINFSDDENAGDLIITVKITNKYDDRENGNIIIKKEFGGNPEDFRVNEFTIFYARVRDITADNYLLFKNTPQADGSYRCVGNDKGGLSEAVTGTYDTIVEFSVNKPVTLSNLWANHTYEVEEVYYNTKDGKYYSVSSSISTLYLEKAPEYTGNNQKLLNNQTITVAVKNTYPETPDNTTPGTVTPTYIEAAVKGEKNITVNGPGTAPSKEFQFNLIEVDKNGEIKNVYDYGKGYYGGYSDMTQNNGGEFEFTLKDLVPNTIYYFKITETDNSDANWEYDTSSYIARVDVSAQGVATVSYPSGNTFTNKYTPPSGQNPNVTTTTTDTATPTTTTTVADTPNVNDTTPNLPRTPSLTTIPATNTTPAVTTVTAAPLNEPEPHITTAPPNDFETYATTPTDPYTPASPEIPESPQNVSLRISKELTDDFGDLTGNGKVFAIRVYDSSRNLIDRVMVYANQEAAVVNGLKSGNLYYIQEEEGDGFTAAGIEIAGAGSAGGAVAGIRIPAFDEGHLELQVIVRNRADNLIDIPDSPIPLSFYPLPPDNPPLIDIPDSMIPLSSFEFPQTNPHTDAVFPAIKTAAAIVFMALAIPFKPVNKRKIKTK